MRGERSALQALIGSYAGGDAIKNAREFGEPVFGAGSGNGQPLAARAFEDVRPEYARRTSGAVGSQQPAIQPLMRSLWRRVDRIVSGCFNDSPHLRQPGVESLRLGRPAAYLYGHNIIERELGAVARRSEIGGAVCGLILVIGCSCPDPFARVFE